MQWDVNRVRESNYNNPGYYNNPGKTMVNGETRVNMAEMEKRE